MINIKALKISIYNQISEIIATHDMTAPQDAVYPYAVYKLPSSFNGNKDNNQDIQFTLEIQLWDKNSDASNIDDLCSDLDNSLNGLNISDPAFYYRIERISPYLQIPDPVDDIQHRELRYLVKVQFL